MMYLLKPSDAGMHVHKENIPEISAFRSKTIRWLLSPGFLSLLIALVVFSLYANSLRGEWILDDYSDVLGPNAIRHLWPLSSHFFQDAGGVIVTHSRPLVSISFALNTMFGQDNPFQFHVMNVTIHVLAALCLFELLRRTLRIHPSFNGSLRSTNLLAFMVALAWGIHPLQTEAVAYITQRYESIMGLFVFVTLLCVNRSAESRSPRVWITLAVCSCLLALASKEVAVSLPILALLYDRAFLAGSFREAWRVRRALYLALGFTWGLFLWNQLHVANRVFAGFALPMPWWQYAANQPSVILHYLRLTFWPHPLVLDYAWPPAGSISTLLPALLLIGSLLVTTLVGLWKSPAWGFLGGFFFLVLAPTSSFMPILDLAVEHRMYLPLASVLVAVFLGLHELARRITSKHSDLTVLIHRSALASGAIAMIALATLTFLRNAEYRTALGMSLDTVAKRPDNPRAHVNLAHALNQDGKLGEAVRQVRIAVRLAPNNALNHLTLGAFLDMQGLQAEAIQELQQATRLNSQDPKPWMILGEIYQRERNSFKAIEYFQKALSLDPGFPNANYLLANELCNIGEYDAALRNYRSAVQSEPGSSLPHWGSGMVLLRQGQLAESLREFDTYVLLEGNTADASTAVGQIFYANGRPYEALRFWQQALQSNPEHSLALLSTSWVLSTNPQSCIRNGQQALELAESVLQRKPGINPAALDVLASAYAELGRFTEASIAAEEAILQAEQTHSLQLADIRSRLKLYRSGQPYRDHFKKDDQPKLGP